MAFRAVTVRNQAMGRTAGEALDALTSQLPPEEGDTLIIVRNLVPDRFFTAEQRLRLEQLMADWRWAPTREDPSLRTSSPSWNSWSTPSSAPRPSAAAMSREPGSMNRLYPLVAQRAGHRCEYCRAPRGDFQLPLRGRAYQPEVT